MSADHTATVERKAVGADHRVGPEPTQIPEMERYLYSRRATQHTLRRTRLHIPGHMLAGLFTIAHRKSDFGVADLLGDKEHAARQ
jgi:hypothetical protein